MYNNISAYNRILNRFLKLYQKKFTNVSVKLSKPNLTQIHVGDFINCSFYFDFSKLIYEDIIIDELFQKAIVSVYQEEFKKIFLNTYYDLERDKWLENQLCYDFYLKSNIVYKNFHELINDNLKIESLTDDVNLNSKVYFNDGLQELNYVKKYFIQRDINFDLSDKLIELYYEFEKLINNTNWPTYEFETY